MNIRRLVMLAIFVMGMSISVFSAVAQETPPQIGAALAKLSTFVGRPLTLDDLDSYRWQGDRYLDSALGCTLMAGTPIPESIVGYTFTLVYQGTTYDLRVSENQAIVFACDARLIEQGLIFDAAADHARTQIVACPPEYTGFLRPRLRVNGHARIAEDGAPNRLRDAPSTSGAQTGTIQPGTVMDVLAGPSCDPTSQIVWWFVRFSGTSGWTAEGMLPTNYFLSPYGATNSGSLSIPEERSLIASGTINTLVPFGTISPQGATDIAYTGNGNLLAVGSFNGVAVYDLDTLQQVALPALPATISAVALSDDGRYLAVGTCEGDLVIVELTTNAALTRTGILPSCINALDFGSIASQYHLAAGSGTLFEDSGRGLIIDAASPVGTILLEIEPDFMINDVTFNEDGTLIAWLASGLTVLEVPTFESVVNLGLEALTPVGNVQFQPMLETSDIISAYTEGNRVKLFHGEMPVMDYELTSLLSSAADFAFSPNGTLIAVLSVPVEGANDPSMLTIFDVETADIVYALELQGTAITFSDDGSLLFVAGLDGVTVFGIP